LKRVNNQLKNIYKKRKSLVRRKNIFEKKKDLNQALPNRLSHELTEFLLILIFYTDLITIINTHKFDMVIGSKNIALVYWICGIRLRTSPHQPALIWAIR